MSRPAQHRDSDCTGVWEIVWNATLDRYIAECNTCNATSSDTAAARAENELNDAMRLAARNGAFMRAHRLYLRSRI